LRFPVPLGARRFQPRTGLLSESVGFRTDARGKPASTCSIGMECEEACPVRQGRPRRLPLAPQCQGRFCQLALANPERLTPGCGYSGRRRFWPPNTILYNQNLAWPDRQSEHSGLQKVNRITDESFAPTFRRQP